MNNIRFVFVSGPLSGDVEENVGMAIKYSSELIDNGYVPITPHLMHYIENYKARYYGVWLNLSLELMTKADAVLRIPGDSPGADIEVREAEKIGIPVFYSIEDLNK